MTDPVAIESSEPLTKLNYSVLLEKVKDGLYAATVWGLPDCKATGATRDEALENVRQLLTARLEKAEIVSVEMEIPKPEHPWMKFAGIFKDDPDLEAVLEDIKELRREKDAEMEDYYRQLDAEEAVRSHSPQSCLGSSASRRNQ